ncbi:MAG TPA: hypothetical protein VLJ10_00515, partial [Candidatus Bathyarchaeia archaeon]|nr:hypothetical protein [Candidatus Bathyarchaeia archaeon]
LIELGYIKLGDFLVMGLGEKTVRVTVDVWAGEREGLSQDPLWKQLQERALLGSDKTGFFRYADFMAGVREAMQQFPAKGRPLDAATQARIDESFRYAEAFNAFFFSVTYGKVWHGLMEVSFDLQKMPDEIKKVYNQPAGANRSTAFIPSDVIMYSWTTMMGLPFYLETWQREEKRNQPPEADAQNPVAGEAEAVPGMPTPVQGALAAMDTSGLSKMFTDELGWFFSGFKISQIAPVPNLVIFLGVQDPAKVETFLAEKLRSTLPVPLQTENYNGVTISYLGGIPFLTGIEPAYCMIDGFFLVSTQRELLKKSIDLKAAGSGGIEANPVVGQAGYGLLDQGNGMMFIQCDGLMNSLLELVHWANRWADVQFERRQAFKKGSEQRLVDVKAEMEKKQQELDPLEQQLVTLQEQKAALEATPTDDVTVSEEVTRRQKIIAAAEKSLAALEKERVDLEKIKNTPGQQLPPEGEKRLTDLNLEIEEKDSRIKTLRRELAPFEAAQKKELDRAQQIAALGTQIQELENLFGQGRQALKASEATVQELETTIKGYETDPSPKPGQRKIMIDELIDPLIKALMNIKWVSIKTRVDPGWMTSDVYGEIK